MSKTSVKLRGSRIKASRESIGMTQEQLATALGVAYQQIWRWESGKNDAAGEVIARMAEIFNVTSDYLLGLVDEPMSHLTEEELSPMERRLLATFRSGEFMRMIQMLSDEALAEIPKQRDISTDKPVMDG